MTAWRQHNVLTSAKNDIVNLSLGKGQIFSGVGRILSTKKCEIFNAWFME
jgi:hypothetical protein